VGKDNLKYLALAALAVGVPAAAGAFTPAAGATAAGAGEATGTTLASGIAKGAATKTGAMQAVAGHEAAAAALGKAGSASTTVQAAADPALKETAKVGLGDKLLGYGAQAATLAGGAAALRKPKLPQAARAPATPSYAADSAAAAERRRKQALAAYGPMSTIKTGPLGLGGGSSTLGGGGA